MDRHTVLRKSTSKIKYTLEIEEAALWWGEKDPQMNVFIESINSMKILSAIGGSLY
jgi:hypothetical protein